MSIPNQPIYRGEPRPQAKQSRAGLIVMLTSLLLAIVAAIFPNFFFSRFVLFGIFGVYIFSLLTLMFVLGLALHYKRRYKISRRYITLSCMLVFFMFTAIHIAATSTQLSTYNFSEYLAHPFNERTPGGLLFSVPSFVLHAVFFLEGSLIVLGVMFIVTAAFLTTYIVTSVGENRVITRAPRLVERSDPLRDLPEL